MHMLQKLLGTKAPGVTILIRVLVGWVFLSEGIQKFLFPDAVGVGRFAKIGIPQPEILASFVGTVEIVGGSMILMGIGTRLAAMALLTIISVAILSTKVPILLGHDLWGFHVAKLGRYGLWSMLHEARTDFSMWLGLLYLLIVGAGAWSVDASFSKRSSHGSSNGEGSRRKNHTNNKEKQ